MRYAVSVRFKTGAHALFTIKAGVPTRTAFLAIEQEKGEIAWMVGPLPLYDTDPVPGVQ